MKQILSTTQLQLREFDLNDTDFIIQLVNSPKWIEFIGDRNIKSQAEAKTYLTNGPIKSYADYGFGLWLVELKEEALPIGMCGLLKRDYLASPDIGFALLPEYLGKGYGHEIAQATLQYARDQLKITEILAITDEKNIISIKLLTKLGLYQNKEIVSPHGDQLLLFSSTQKEI